jgi:glycerate kinase
MHVLLAFDKFKDSMSAAEACAAAEKAIHEVQPEWMVESAPLTDGGEGFATILASIAGGRLETRTVPGPRFNEVEAIMGWAKLETLPASVRALLDVPESGELAIIEMAQASGLEQLTPEERDLWHTTTIGTGELIRYAADAGAAAILLGIGGSATNDLGMGALEGMGIVAYDHEFQQVTQFTPARFKHIASLSGIVNVRRKMPPVRIACDVTNPLLGPLGAAAVFGPQKGLQPVDYDRFERLMRKTADRLLGLFGHEPETFEARRAEAGAGAAGGIGFGLRTALPDSAFVPGFELVKGWIELEAKLARADLVITGEGAFDQSSLHGKGPSVILENLRDDQRVMLFAGRIDPDALAAVPRTIPSYSIGRTDWPLEKSLAEGPGLLAEAVKDALR